MSEQPEHVDPPETSEAAPSGDGKGPAQPETVTSGNDKASEEPETANSKTSKPASAGDDKASEEPETASSKASKPASAGDDEPAEDPEAPKPPDRLLHLRWDLDKTYLRTEFDSLKDLYRTFRQRAEDKVSIAGARTLLRELVEPRGDVLRRVTFISGSPNQMRKVLTRKLALDGIEPDVFILKPNLSNLLRGRFRALRGQVGYKLKALLHSHMAARQVDEYLFGDDAEQDAFVYSLYGDMVAGRVDGTALAAILNIARVYRRDVDEIMALHSKLYNTGDVVRRILIHLEARSPLDRFTPYGGRVVPIYNYFQAALLLAEAGLIEMPAARRVVDAMGAAGYTPARLASSIQDLMRRGVLVQETVKTLENELSGADSISGRPPSLFIRKFEEVISGMQTVARPCPANNPEINYIGLFHAARFRRTRHRLLGTGIRILD